MFVRTNRLRPLLFLPAGLFLQLQVKGELIGALAKKSPSGRFFVIIKVLYLIRPLL